MKIGTEDQYSVKVSGPGLSADQMVGKDVALEIISAMLGGRAPVLDSKEAREADGSNKDSALGKPISIREYLIESKAKTNKEKIVVIGNYLCTHDKKEDFSMEDMRNGFRSAREALPKNISRDFGKVCEEGWAHEAGTKGKFYITITGLNVIERKFGRK